MRLTRSLTAQFLTLPLLVVPLLVGCGVSEEELQETVGSLPGVESADSECADFSCDLRVVVEPEATSEQITAVLGATRTVDHVDEVHLSLRLGEANGQARIVSATIDAEKTPTDQDAATATLLAWGASTSSVTKLSVTPAPSGPMVEATLESSLWSHAEELWAMTDELPDASLVAQRPSSPQQVLRTTEGVDSDVIALAAEWEARPTAGVTGVALLDGRILVGSTQQSAALKVREQMAADPRAAGLRVDALATTDLLTNANAEPSQLQQLGPLLLLLESQPGVQGVAVESAAARVRVDVSGYAAAGRAVRAVRQEELGQVGATLLITPPAPSTSPDSSSSSPPDLGVEIIEGGDDQLLQLAETVLETWPDAELRITQDSSSDPRPVGVTLGLLQPGPGRGSAPGLGPYVRAFATLVTRSEGTTEQYQLGIRVADADGRSASVNWEAARDGGSWTLGEVSGTPDRAKLVRRQWTRALG